MLKIPYAIRDFETLIGENYLYFDRTDRISVLEETGRELLFLRPRRFGKSLWLSTLCNYYDVAQADKFERLFGQLAIGQNPTPLCNQYLVMKWDFSVINAYGRLEQIERSLHSRVNMWLRIFAETYRDYLNAPIYITDNALVSFDSVVTAVSQTPYRLYLFIDEYDNFANSL